VETERGKFVSKVSVRVRRRRYGFPRHSVRGFFEGGG
jgi:hypothetical protein